MRKLGDYFDLVTGQYYPYSDFCDDGVRCLKIDNVGYGKIIWENTTLLPENYLENFPDLVLKNGDIVIALNRPVTNGNLKIGMLNESDSPSILYQRVGKFVCKLDGVDKQFIYSFFNSDYFKKKILASLVGSDQPYIRNSSLLNIQIPVPTMPEQRKIAVVLSTVEKKLEIERKHREHLEMLRRGLMQDLLTGRVRVKVDDHA